MEWQDEAIVLSARRHGETGTVLEVLTRAHGRHLGLVRGGQGAKTRPLLEPGNDLLVTWRARLSEHLGAFSVEPVRIRAAGVLLDAEGLLVLGAALAVTSMALPERERHEPAFEALEVLLDSILAGVAWGELYVRYETGLLQEVGYGLDLSACALTGATDGLSHVSPRTGRAVALSAAQAAGHDLNDPGLIDKLLRLPPFLASAVRPGAPTPPRADLLDGLALTAHFLGRVLAKPLPDIRARMVDRLKAREG